MITTVELIAVIVFIGAPFWLYHKLLTETISRLRADNTRLYSDNQSLMQALAQANGQILEFKPPETKNPQPVKRSVVPAPYWEPRKEREIQIGEKKVTIQSNF